MQISDTNYSKKFDIKPPSILTFPAGAELPSLVPLKQRRMVSEVRNDHRVDTYIPTNALTATFSVSMTGTVSLYSCAVTRCTTVLAVRTRGSAISTRVLVSTDVGECRPVFTLTTCGDRLPQCPQQDDERYCDTDCPSQCSCQGLAFTCHRPFPLEEYSNIRYLDASRSGVKPQHLSGNTLLIYLNLQLCHLTSLTLPKLPNLRFLDIR